MKKEALRIQSRLAELSRSKASEKARPPPVASLGQAYPIDLEFVQSRVGVWVPDPDFYTTAATQYPPDFTEGVDAAIADVITASESVSRDVTSGSDGRVWMKQPQWELASAVLSQQLRRGASDSVAPVKPSAVKVSSTFAGWIGKATGSEDASDQHAASETAVDSVDRKIGQPGYRAGWHAATGDRDDTTTMVPHQ